jgi:hypothetical protein
LSLNIQTATGLLEIGGKVTKRNSNTSFILQCVHSPIKNSLVSIFITKQKVNLLNLKISLLSFNRFTLNKKIQ